MASDNSEDAMMAAAIKASLEDAHNQSTSSSNAPKSKPSKNRVVDLTHDSDNDSDVQVVFPKSNSVVGSDTDAEASDDDSDLKRAIALSLGNKSPETEKSPNHSPKKQEMKSTISSDKPPATQGILGLDRKQMEQERLMRLNKRKASDPDPGIEAELKRPSKTARTSPSPGFEFVRSTQKPPTSASQIRDTSSGYKVVDVKYFSPTPDAKNVSNSTSQNLTSQDLTFQNVAIQPAARSKEGIQWPSGTVKKTRLSKSPRKPDDVSLEEVLQSNDLELAVMSSFLWDMEWVLRKLDTKKTRILFVVHAPNEERPMYEAEAASIPNLRFCFPSLDGQINIMHSKLMLLFHPGYLRIVVPTANLIQVDWGDHNLMENTVFMVDLPLKSKTAGVESSSGDTNDDTYTQFYNDLVVFLTASSYPQGIIEKLAKFDFSKTARYAFVHSIGGSHTDESWRWTGYTGLGRAVSNLGLRTQSPVTVDFITSSLGSLNDDLIRAIYLACKGDDGSTDYQFRNTKPSAKAKSPLQGICQEWRDRFRVYFPSSQTVDASVSARSIGMVLNSPGQILRDCHSQRDVLMHNKIAFVKPSEPISLPDGSECRGWAYVGSANLSESAWGRLVKDRATGEPKLNCRNWECGVLVPVTGESDTTAASSSSGELDVDLFKDTIPVPMKVPSERLGPGREPWFFMG
ncbi:tyrosyl-DNA phosphodiesterase-domain-containing protein [Penicillium hetheringtonii]|uniref:Tyrosyl-DNA phosphodiesterase-domain-containing protein n=1 Tax=Penicillium hetheringtonii TaxID=911720 RepID=A0AAD6H2A1_9EURO|nr:tyrosyl-DNA phosphodiesterase-domain-containing protein [Penicillium hetheringtonii]